LIWDHNPLASDRVTKGVTIATTRGGRRRTSTAGRSQVRHAAALAARVVTWLRDEEAMVADQTWTRRVIDPPSMQLSALWTYRLRSREPRP